MSTRNYVLFGIGCFSRLAGLRGNRGDFWRRAPVTAGLKAGEGMSKKRRTQMQKRRPPTPKEQAPIRAEWQEMTEALLSGKPYETMPPIPRGKPLTGNSFRRWYEEWDAIRPLLFQCALDAYQQGASPQAAAETAVQEHAPWSDGADYAEWRAGYIAWLAYSLPTWNETGKLPA